MTVCTASIFTWNYSENGETEFGQALLIASDRMYSDTGLGIEYESSRAKVAHLDNHRMVLVSGDLSLNSRAIGAIRTWKEQNPDADTNQVAIMYGQIVAALSFERASKYVLNPLGIFADEIISDEIGLKKYGLPDQLIVNLAEKLQSTSLDTEAIIVGIDEDKRARLYRIDGKGIVTLHSDIGFVSIGSGGIHSSAYFMQLPYDHNVMFAGALVSTYFAKKRSEVAPGVGTTTDMYLITAYGTTLITAEELKLLERIYHQEKRQNARFRVTQSNKFFKTMQQKQGFAAAAETNAPTNDKQDTSEESN